MMLLNNKFLVIPVLSVLLFSACKLATNSSISSSGRSPEQTPKPLSMPATPSQIETHPDRIVTSKKLVGRFSEFIWGDYLYAKIRAQTGEEISFMMDKNESCFLAEYKETQLTIAYDAIERYIRQAGGYHRVNIIRAIETDGTNLAKWQRSLTTEQLEKCRENIR
jgi:hypothetical protein